MTRAVLATLIACSSGVAAERFIEGIEHSPVRVLIFEDMQCPDCADFRRMLDERLLPNYATRVTFEHRDFPLAKHAWARKAAIAARFDALSPLLNEKERRLLVAIEASTAGRGGVAAASRATGVARSTIGRGLSDLRDGAERLGQRVRRVGGGKKAAIELQPGLLLALNDLVEPAIRGDPEAALLWVSKSQRHLSAALAERGFTAGQKLVGRLLKHLGFSLQANSKTREGASHPDRNAQFEHINAEVKAFQAAGEPVISVDTKKKELVGNFKNGGRELRPKGQPEPVRVHDFMIPELGKAVPYGVYDITASTTSPRT